MAIGGTLMIWLLARQLNSRDPNKIKRAVSTLGEKKNKKALDLLVHFLSQSHMKEEVLTAIASHPNARSVLDSLLPVLLKASDHKVHQRFINLLSRIDPNWSTSHAARSFVFKVKEILRDPKGNGRAAAVFTIAALPGEDHFNEIISLLSDAKESVRDTAAEVLCQNIDQRSIPHLTHFLLQSAGRSKELQKVCIKAIAKVHDPSAHTALTELATSHKNPEISKCAIQMMVECGLQKAGEFLLRDFRKWEANKLYEGLLLVFRQRQPQMELFEQAGQRLELRLQEAFSGDQLLEIRPLLEEALKPGSDGSAERKLRALRLMETVFDFRELLGMLAKLKNPEFVAVLTEFLDGPAMKAPFSSYYLSDVLNTLYALSPRAALSCLFSRVLIGVVSPTAKPAWSFETGEQAECAEKMLRLALTNQRESFLPDQLEQILAIQDFYQKGKTISFGEVHHLAAQQIAARLMREGNISSDVNLNVAEAIIHQLATKGNHAGVGPLKQLLNSSHYEIREGAVKALGTIGDGEALETLIGLANDAEFSPGHVVIQVLAALKNPRSIEVLIHATRNPKNAGSAARALQAFSQLEDSLLWQERIKEVIREFNTDNAEQLRSSVHLLSYLGRPNKEVKSALLRALQDRTLFDHEDVSDGGPEFSDSFAGGVIGSLSVTHQYQSFDIMLAAVEGLGNIFKGSKDSQIVEAILNAPRSYRDYDRINNALEKITGLPFCSDFERSRRLWHEESRRDASSA